jgi:hypothetical protein
MEKHNHLRSSLEALRDVGLEAKLDHILGLPDEPPSAQEEARKLYVEFGARRVQTFWLTYMPGIELTKEALAKGVLTQTEVDEINRGKARTFRHTKSTSDGVANDDDFYLRYDVLFRILPFLPDRIRKKLRLEHIPRMSERTSNAIGFVFDLANALRRLDKETLIFARQYGRQALRILPERLLGALFPTRPPKVRPPTRDGTFAPQRPKNDAPSAARATLPVLS